MQCDDLPADSSPGKKVLFVHNIMAPYRLPIFRRLSQYHDVKLFFLRKTHEYRKWQVRPDEAPPNYRVSRGPVLFGAVICLDLLWELLRTRYEVVIVGESSLETVPACLMALFFRILGRGRLVLVTERFQNPGSHVRKRFLNRFARAPLVIYLRFLYKGCDAFVACSSKAAAHLRRSGVDEKKVFQSAQAVFDTQGPSRDETQRKDANLVTILTVAYLEDRKGIDLLIKAFKAMDDHKTRLIIAGDGEIRAKLEALASGTKGVTFVGYVEGAKKRDLFLNADLFVLPSRFETWGLVVNEAMHYSLPVIITDVMGSTDIVDGNGIIVPAGNVDLLAGALKKLTGSRDLRASMARRARDIIGSIDLDAVTKPLLRAIGRAVEPKQRESLP
ncbi:MAG: Alpha-D-kanosaminyltransferase [Syntrophorhabdaceae bacterium PtaU1.Bin034]|jgi:glycosyltransferase involved in cell wall biosynthesis|nr:MAG: Alpha-D-kanosaminyltransferase [Syntrophorhabdaceae bacterium PtaU1.Bin034]